jgi:hypothetical protein
MADLLAPVSVGELIDKITILEIKASRFNGEKLRNVRDELARLERVYVAFAEGESISAMADFAAMKLRLADVNKRLWVVEDEIRACEARREFGDRFVEFARLVYCLNDQRAAIKRELNLAFGSDIIEEKGYAGVA